jgi:L-fuconolactonase
VWRLANAAPPRIWERCDVKQRFHIPGGAAIVIPEITRKRQIAIRGNMTFTRRHILKAAAAVALAPCVMGAPVQPLVIVDTHQHLWALDKFHLPWLDPAEPLLKRNYLMADYLQAVEGLNVTRAVYMEVEVAPDEFDREADSILDVCRKGDSPTVAAVIGGHPESDHFRSYITRFKGNQYVKGVRSPFPADGASNPKFIDGLKLLGDLGMSYDLLADPAQLPLTAKLVQSCKDTRFILDHCGNGSTKFYLPAAERDSALLDRRKKWEEGLAALASQKNVICKISGVAEAGDPADATAENIAPVVNRCIDSFGEDRVIFASNWPVVLKSLTLKQWVHIARQITASRGEAFARKLFGENAVRFYGL